MRNSPYIQLLERLLRHPYAEQMGCYAETANDMIEHEDFDHPIMLRSTATGRMMLVMEGPREIVGPIAEQAYRAVGALGDKST